MLQFIARIDPDCDGIFSDIYRIDVPADLRDADAMNKAVELGQIRFPISDPTEWFTVPEDKQDVIRAKMGYGTDRAFCSIKGNVFN